MMSQRQSGLSSSSTELIPAQRQHVSTAVSDLSRSVAATVRSVSSRPEATEGGKNSCRLPPSVASFSLHQRLLSPTPRTRTRHGDTGDTGDTTRT